MLQDSFSYTVEQFADLQILRYRVPGFENLPLRRKQLIYYLSQAALEGRDILFDQNGKYNLQIRRLLEAVYIHFTSSYRHLHLLIWKKLSTHCLKRCFRSKKVKHVRLCAISCFR